MRNTLDVCHVRRFGGMLAAKTRDLPSIVCMCICSQLMKHDFCEHAKPQKCSTVLQVFVGRVLPWPCVEFACNWLEGPPSQCAISTHAYGFPMAFVGPLEKVVHMGNAVITGWEKPDWPREGELWIRWAMDRLPIWNTTVSVCELSWASN